MQSLSEFWPVWLLYMGSALLGLWCFRRMFFWLKPGSDTAKLLTMLMAAIVITPAPITDVAGYYAPAIFVLIMGALEGQAPLSSPALLWLLSGAFVGGIVLVLHSSVRVFMLKNESE